MKRIALTLLALATSAVAVAQQPDAWSCTLGELQRRVEIVYEPGRAVPCEVHYYKDTETPGERQVLWRAENQSGYCETQSADFVARLESQGWACAAAADRDAADDAPAPDDTESLAPANPDNR